MLYNSAEVYAAVGIKLADSRVYASLRVTEHRPASHESALALSTPTREKHSPPNTTFASNRIVILNAVKVLLLTFSTGPPAPELRVRK